MSAQLWTTGPAHLYIGFPGAGGGGYKSGDAGNMGFENVVGSSSGSGSGASGFANFASSAIAAAQSLVSSAVASVGNLGPAAIAGASSISNGSALYLGTALDAPEIELVAGFTPVPSDRSGPRGAHDWFYDAEEGFISAALTRWNEKNYQKAAARLATQAAAGATDGDAAGTLMIAEQATCVVYVVFPYSGFGAFRDMPAGYRFTTCLPEGPDKRRPGTGPNSLAVLFHAVQQYGSDGSGKLYDFNVAGLPAPE